MAADSDASPTDATSKQAVLATQIREALSELNRPADGLFLSALSAGLDIGYGPMLMAILLTVAEFSFSTPLVKELVMANAYSVGFVFVVLGNSELFTEHTTLAVLPVLDGEASVSELGRLWGLVYVGNLVGAVAFAAVIVVVMPAIDVVDPKAFGEIASSLTGHHWSMMVVAGVLAGWLMGLMSWLVAGAQESISRLAVVWLIAVAIGLAHLPHSIAGSVEVLAGVFAGSSVTVVDYAQFLATSTVGNAIGGATFVALLKYGHVVRSGPEPEEISLDE